MSDLQASRDRLFATGFGAVDLASALIVLLGVFVGLPVRYWPIDVGAVVLLLAFLGAGVGLLGRTPWGRDAARIASVVALALGLLLIALLAVSVSYLNGIYGPVGKGG